MLHLDWEFHFHMTYEVEQLGRIDRTGGLRVYGYPDAEPLSPQQDVAAGPILRVTPHDGNPWIGVFDDGGFDYATAASPRVIGWPDGNSFCVVYTGGAVVVRADDPTCSYEIDVNPVTGTFVAAKKGVVVFADFTNASAYGRDGLLWQSPRLALDELRIDGIEGDSLQAHGFFGGSSGRFMVDLASGEPSGQPFQPPD
jgi:hypothetical protein